MALGCKLWFRVEADPQGQPAVLARDARDRRRLARCVLGQAGAAGLLAFRAVGANLRLVVNCDSGAARDLGRRLKIGLGRRLALTDPFGRTVVEELRDQWHLQNNFVFVLRNGDPLDPYHEASILPDLLGMRILAGNAATNVREMLPRITRGHLLDHLGRGELEPQVWLDDLEEAAAAAIGRFTLCGRRRDQVAARVALVAAVGRRLNGPELARRLDVSEATIKRDRQRWADPRLVRAIMLQMTIRRPPLT